MTIWSTAILPKIVVAQLVLVLVLVLVTYDRIQNSQTPNPVLNHIISAHILILYLCNISYSVDIPSVLRSSKHFLPSRSSDKKLGTCRGSGGWSLASTAEARFRSQATPWRICGGQNYTGSVIPLMLQIHLLNLLAMLQNLSHWERV